MRLAGQAQLGYFPTPETQLPLIASWLKLGSEANRTPRTIRSLCW